MKYTLLQLVQLIASSMDSDQINSIGDSTEAQQIANVIQTAYYDIINRGNFPEHFTTVNLNPPLTLSQPTIMYVPNTVENIYWVKYNKRILTSDPPYLMDVVNYLDLDTFLRQMYYLNPQTMSNVGSFTLTTSSNSLPILYTNDKPPDYYTTMDDNTLIFDSYNAAVESTLQASNSLAYGRLTESFQLIDTFIPNLSDEQFALLLNEAKSLAWAELKQTGHQLADRNSKRAWTTVQNQKHAIPPLSDFDQLPYFGRR